MRWDLAPDVLTLAGGLMLTWPALRAGRVLGRAANFAQREVTDEDQTARKVHGRFHTAYMADSWRRTDQFWLYLGLIFTVTGALWSVLYEYGHPPSP